MFFFQLIVLALLCLYVPFGGLVFAKIERWSSFDAETFCIETLSTVGYGNITPQTVAGRIFLFFYALFGLAVVISSISVARDIIIDKIRSLVRSRVKQWLKTGKRLFFFILPPVSLSSCLTRDRDSEEI